VPPLPPRVISDDDVVVLDPAWVRRIRVEDVSTTRHDIVPEGDVCDELTPIRIVVEDRIGDPRPAP